jgi:hypothetical protein
MREGWVKAVWAAIFALVAMIVWSRQLVSGGSFDAEKLKATEQIDAAVVSLHAQGGCIHVLCRVVNRGRRHAQNIVLTIRVLDGRGDVIAVNPLVSVSDLSPNAGRDLRVRLPVGAAISDCKAEIESTLVHWAPGGVD